MPSSMLRIIVANVASEPPFGHRPNAVLVVRDAGIARPFPRRVRRRVVQAQVERLARAPRDVLHRALGEEIGEISARGRRARCSPKDPAELPAVDAARIRRDVREVVERAAQAAEELVETVPIRMKLGTPAEMPLADQRGFVAGRRASASRPSDGRPECRRAASAGRVAPASPTVEPLRIATRDERAARRRAHGRGRIGAREPHALRREPIEHGCLVVRSAVAATRSP